MKKVLLTLLLSIFIFSNIAPHLASAYSESNHNTMEEINQVDVNEAEEVAEEVIGEGTNDIEIESTTEDDIGIIDTTIESEDTTVESTLEVDLENDDMSITTEIQDENGDVLQQDFDVIVTEIDGEDFTAVLIDPESGEEYEINTTELQASWAPLVLIAIHVARYGIKYAIKKYGKSVANKAVKKYGKKATAKDLTKLKFANKTLFKEHYKKHKKEYGNISMDSYLKKAQALAGASGKHIKTKKRSNGDVLKYNTKTNDFLSMTKDDTIKTLFKPKRGIKYWNEQ